MDNLEERFWAKVRKTRGCWNWTSSVTHDGYGRFRVRGREWQAARWLYEKVRAPLHAEEILHHTCENPACVKPDHMEPHSRIDHTGISKGPVAENARKTHCIHGHILKGANLYLDPDGKRKCKKCIRDIRARRRDRFNDPRKPKPTKTVLRRQLKRMSLTEIGVHYGVSDTAVRKWATAYELR